MLCRRFGYSTNHFSLTAFRIVFHILVRDFLDRMKSFFPLRLAIACSLGAIAPFLHLLHCIPAGAQIVPDATLPQNSIVAPSGDRFQIDGGTTAGANLFHSFSEFSIPTGGEAFFNNAATIYNILTRVTGGNISNIDGLLRANGTANLFLVNPSGIVFGPDARLDIGGSFIGSTADSIELSDGSFFSAIAPEAPPLLTVSAPVGLQLGADPGGIEVLGAGRQLVLDPPTGRLEDTDGASGLRVAPGEVLALLGGDVTIAGGNLLTEGGTVEIGSASGGTVAFNPTNAGFAFGYEAIADFRDITLNGAGAIANPGGRVRLRGQRVRIVEGARIVASTQQNTIAPGTIDVRASESVNISGSTEAIASGLLAPVESDATVEGGAISIETELLQVADGGQIDTSTFGEGNGGNISIRADRVEVSSNPETPFFTGVFAAVQSEAAGEGGDISIETDLLQVADGGQIDTSTSGRGDGGNISIRADRVEVSSNPEVLFLTGIFASVLDEATGAGGDISIEAGLLQATDGGLIDTSTLGRGDGGNISIRADRVEISSNPEISSFTGLFASILGTAEGNGGDITVEAERVRVADGGQIGVSTFARGSGGNILIRAAEADVLGNPENPILTGAIATVGAGSTGNGGNIAIEAERLQVTNGGAIATDTFSGGNSGNISIRANEIVVLGTPNRDVFTGIFSSVQDIASGNGGDVTVEAERLRVADDGQIASSVFGAGNGGNVAIRASEIELASATASIFTSGIFGSVLAGARGNGGNVSVEADRLQITGGGLLSVRTLGDGNAGNLTVRAAEIELAGAATDGSSFSSISASSTGDFAAGSIAIATERLSLQDGATVGVSGLSTGDAGNLVVTADAIVANNGSQIAATTSSGEGGNLSLQVRDLQLRRTSQITAAAAGTGNGGNATIAADTIALLEDSTISASAVAGNGGNIAIATQGLFASPGSNITASSQFGVDGTVDITNPEIDTDAGLADLSDDVPDPADRVSTSCSVDEGSSFTRTRRGGLPDDPAQPLLDRALWRDWKDYSRGRSAIASVRSVPAAEAVLVEANTWHVAPDGTVALLAEAERSPHLESPTSCRAN